MQPWEFQKILALSYWARADLLLFARLGLVRACVLQVDAAKAKSAYQDILAFWKDPDRPPDRETGQDGARETATIVRLSRWRPLCSAGRVSRVPKQSQRVVSQ